MPKTETRSIRFPAELLEQLQQAADENHRSFQNEVIHRLQSTVDGEMVTITGDAPRALSELVDHIMLDRNTLASAAICHYNMVTAARISTVDVLEQITKINE